MNKKALTAVPLTVAALFLAGCSATGSTSGQASENAAQQADTGNLENNQPLPSVHYSQERENLIDIELAEVNDVQTTTFVKTMGIADPWFTCPSIGFGISDSASLSNPSQISWSYNDWGNGSADSGVIGQMDPNGIYAPTSSAGTWTICLDGTGTPYINRFEDNTNTIGGNAVWNLTTHTAKLVGAPTAAATVIDPSKETKAPKTKATSAK